MDYYDMIFLKKKKLQRDNEERRYDDKTNKRPGLEL